MLVPGLVFAVFTVAAGVIGAGGPRITASAADVAAYYTDHHTLAIGWGTIVFASAIPLAIWAAVVYRRLRQLGITAPGSAIGLAGGLLAAASLAVSGLAIWTAAQTSVASQPEVAAALNALAFATGGAGFVVPLGLMVAGVCVPSLFVRLLPKALAWFGLIVAVLSALATLTLLFEPLGPLLPIGRFGGGVIWLLAASALLPHSRRHRETAAARPESEHLTV
ncbi:DUF4386 domain-containing protein [Amycolatopsis taiwanensis]|uniref:DUF4386 domain-containing protein n=1 Tax=Amycolatopsis taiwanensis TaxID=342230 RepID=A0A9W6R5Z6_9PSEU|nr:DUF4386 domain-containing protein [Amycolatopsis taiwanensis]GLY69631.1 hypothetical protein Atai01_62500 [Amycolatopsis taiwanensis]